ncbi:peptidyl-prolyl cis-trans isomerase [Streptomyces sp. NBC_01614]|uniref:Peptidyl-prolyl cis-trans isomerase n=1 Tax=Streptomyces sp. NBC_00180 TaxID=2903632 RepID=A0AAU1HRT6_9ACTN
MTEEYAARVNGEAVPKERVDTFLTQGPTTPPTGAGRVDMRLCREGATSHNGPAAERRHSAALAAERQRRRWATQVVLVDELARRTCAKRGLPAPPEMSSSLAPNVPEADVADLGSIVAAALAHSPAARALLAALEGEQLLPEEAVREYYGLNLDRFLTPEALRRGVDPFDDAAGPADLLPYEHAREGIVRELQQALGRRAFFDWLDRARTGVEYAPGHEHPGDPSHADHEHRH